MSGMGFGDMMHASADRDTAEMAARREFQGELDRSRSLAREMMDIASGLYEQREALKRQLAVSDPDNALLIDEPLIERIKEASTKAFQAADRDNFEVPRVVGQSFPIPERKGVAQANSSVFLAAELDRYKVAYAGSLAHRKALEGQLRDFNPINPVIYNGPLIERIRLQGEAGYKSSGGNFEAAKQVGSDFPIPGR